jgi:3-methyladenine DNA glycosylase AlkD
MAGARGLARACRVSPARLSYTAIMRDLRAHARPSAKGDMARFGITTTGALGGIPVPYLRDLAGRAGREHALAKRLWASGIHEARLLASMVDVPAEVTEDQMEAWASEFDSWDVVDQSCSNLFDRTPFAHAKAAEWAGREEEFVKRAGFALMAALAVHDKRAPDEALVAFFPMIEREAWDGRNFVKKAVNWALRQIGKRNPLLNEAAIKTAQQIQKLDSRSARWTAADALRELTSETVRQRFRRGLRLSR